MTPAAVAFASGAALLQLQAALPSLLWAGLLPLLLALGLWKRGFLVVFCLAAGFLWAAAWAHSRIADRLRADQARTEKSRIQEWLF